MIGPIDGPSTTTPDAPNGKREGAEFPPRRSLFDSDRLRRTPTRYSDVEDEEEIGGIERVRREERGRNTGR